MMPILINNIRNFIDQRGVFYESYKYSFLRNEYGIEETFVQDNHSVSSKNVIRGLHYQWDKPMGKLVRVAKGFITDVVVDIRKESGDFGKVFYYELNEENLSQLYVPPGFAHGFICKSDEAIVQDKCTAEYNQKGESGINPFDKALDIKWGVEYNNIIVSEKDLNSKAFLEYEREPKF